MGDLPRGIDDYAIKQNELRESEESQSQLREYNLSLLLQLNHKDQLLQRHKVSLIFIYNYSYFKW